VKRINHDRRLSQQGFDHFQDPKRSRSEVSKFRGRQICLLRPSLSRRVKYGHQADHITDASRLDIAPRDDRDVLPNDLLFSTILKRIVHPISHKVIHKTTRVVYPYRAYRLDIQLKRSGHVHG
jgi:hypothetical protein